MNDDDLPTLVWTGPDGELERLVREAQLAVLAEPEVAQRVYRALVAEGRAAAATPEGAARREQLRRSPLLARIRAVWEPATLNLLADTPDRALPSGYVDALVMSLDLPRLEAMLAALGPAGGRA